MSYRSLASAATALIVGAACTFDPSGLAPDPNAADAATSSPDGDGAVSDGPVAAIDAAAPDAGCLVAVLGIDPSNFGRCDVPDPPGTPRLLDDGTWIIDTDDPAATLTFTVIAQDGGPDLLLLAFEEFRLGEDATLRLVGERALAIVTYGDLTIDGTVFIEGRHEEPAAGSGGVACVDGAGAPGSTQSFANAQGGSGGGGGAYGGNGGAGAIVADSVGTEPTPGGVAGGNAGISPLRGGCPGGSGGLGGGLGGAGGGALQLVAGETLSVGGIITAGGGGGRRAPQNAAGGGGGGSGGAILLEATTLVINGMLMAQGGGGGQGRRSASLPNQDGADAFARNAAAAPGGADTSYGGYGGDGAYLAMPAGDGEVGIPFEDVPSGGGGGGGSVGRIHLRALSAPVLGAGAVLSPAPQ